MENDESASNQSGNRSFGEVLLATRSRREVLVGSLATAATAFFAGGTALAGSVGSVAQTSAHRRSRRLIDFTPVRVAEGNGPWPAVSPDYDWDVLIPWGDPLEPGGPAFEWPPTAAAQAEQVGIGHDGMSLAGSCSTGVSIFPIPSTPTRKIVSAGSSKSTRRIPRKCR